MKKRILIVVAALVLSALTLLLLPAPQREPTPTTVPSTSAKPTETQPTTGTQPTTTVPEEPGMVRLYSCDDRLLTVFRTLAAEYSAQTGVEVQVLSPEIDGCQATLQRLMQSEDPPTMFCIHNQKQLKFWQNTLLDLDGTALSDALCNNELGMRLDGKLLALPASVRGYGLLANLELLGAVLSRSDITDFNSLTMWVSILKDNSIKAFPTSTFNLQDAWYLLMNEDLQSARAFFDLYAGNSSRSGDPMTLFMTGKTAFFLGDTGDYSALAEFTEGSVHLRDLDILPTYANGAMQYICDTAWCLNASARQTDIDATLSFMTWLVTAQADSAAPVDQFEMLSPFTDAAWYGNLLEKKLRGYMSAEAAVIQWDGGEMGTDPLLMALNDYIASRTDENWQLVEQIVQQFRAEYAYNS